MFEHLGHLAFRRRRAILVLAALLTVACGLLSSGVFSSLSNGGFADPSSDSSRAAQQVATQLGRRDADVIVLIRSADRTVDQPAFRQAVTAIAESLPQHRVAHVQTYWTAHDARLVSADRHATYAVLTLAGADDDARRADLHALEPALRTPRPGFTVEVGGEVAVFDGIDAQVRRDVERAELISFPVLLILLLVVFGGVVAAATPLLIGALTVIGALAVLRLLTLVTTVSVFSVNLVSMLGLGLAIDYALFVVTRFREELGRRDDVGAALAATMATAGRTVVFSGVTVALALASLLVFPAMFLRSMAYGGVAAVLIAVIASVTALPALLAVLGRRIDALPVRRALPPAQHAMPRPGAWERVARGVMRHPWRVVVLLVPVLVLLGVPFLHVQLGGADYRVLPARAESRGVAQQLAADFPRQGQSVLTVAITSRSPASSGSVRREVQAYLHRVAQVPGVDGATVLGAHGQLTAAVLDLRDDPQTLSARRTLERVRAVTAPPDTQVLVGGETARAADLIGALQARLPLMIGWIVLVTLILLFLAFGSLVVPLKALAMNVLSLSAAFGSLVWIFQEGHAAGLLHFTPSGYLEASQPLLLFTVAFGLSMDYEVFLLSRIREHYDQTGNNTEAVAAGLQRTGRLISCAAVLLGAVLAAFTTSEIVYSKMLGLGIILALIIDATIIRSLLVPATMRLMGRANWWAPGPLLRLWERYGIGETDEPREPDGSHRDDVPRPRPTRQPRPAPQSRPARPRPTPRPRPALQHRPAPQPRPSKRGNGLPPGVPTNPGQDEAHTAAKPARHADRMVGADG